MDYAINYEFVNGNETKKNIASVCFRNFSQSDALCLSKKL